MSLINPPIGAELCETTQEKVRFLWEKMKNYDTLFTDVTRWDFEHFTAILTHPNTLCIEVSGGVIILTDILLNWMTQIHACLWDHKLSARLSLLQDCITWAFSVFGFTRLEAVIPDFSRGLRRFLERRLNFTREGILRRRMLYRGSFHDVLVYSLLREEAIWE